MILGSSRAAVETHEDPIGQICRYSFHDPLGGCALVGKICGSGKPDAGGYTSAPVQHRGEAPRGLHRTNQDRDEIARTDREVGDANRRRRKPFKPSLVVDVFASYRCCRARL